jgi:hypothetical protein
MYFRKDRAILKILGLLSVFGALTFVMFRAS